MKWLRYSVFLLLFSLLVHCGKPGGKAEFPGGTAIIQPKYTRLFTIAYNETDTFLKLTDPADSSKELGNFCWGQGNRLYPEFTRIKDRSRMVVLSAVFVGMLEALHAEKNIVAVDNGNYISSPRTQIRIRAGEIRSVSGNGQADREMIARQKPGLVIGYYIDIKGRESLKPLADKGIPVLFLQNFLESHPLGRAEWLLVMGALSGQLSKAQSMFAEIEEHYESTMARVPEGKGPSVLVNAPFSGVWDVPAGDSYMARLIRDAGGDYVFADSKGTGRIPLDIEKVHTRGAGALVWINPGACRDSSCLLMMDVRIRLFTAFRNGNIFNCTKLLKENGANAWWDYGVMRPDLVLLDLFSILHPEIEMTHEPVFFEKIK